MCEGARHKQNLTGTIAYPNDANDLAPHANTPAQAKSLPHSLEQAARGAGLYMNSDKTGLVWFYGISAILGYLMPNPVFIYILNIWFVDIS